ncbi:MAG: tail fiber domain-containing protein [Flavobacteriales bacterium]|nr:tail fiber domain-containing protein [Flavobacteriales bacterium]
MRLVFFLLIVTNSVMAQVGINTSNPKAQLEIQSSDQANPIATDGILIPKVDVFPAVNPTLDQDGMMVYLTTLSGTNEPGFYYWDNTNSVWKGIGKSNGWSLTGNTGTDSTVNFIGTTDDTNVIFKRNNIQAGLLDTNTTSFGVFALASTSTGVRNTAIGYTSLAFNSTGFDNTAVGYSTLNLNTTGYYNTATGSFSVSKNTTGNNNTGNGFQTLLSNTTGNNNTAMGSATLNFSTTGSDNTAIGAGALNLNTTGSNNVSVGFISMQDNTTGYENVAIGNASLTYNTTGFDNTACGHDSMYFNTTGSYNVANGYQALYRNTVGIGNNAHGNRALYSNVSGNGNTAFGNATLYNNIASENTAVGNETLFNNTNGNSNVAMGNRALYSSTTGEKNVAIGNYAGSQITNHNQNTAIGNDAMRERIGAWNTAVGSGALYSGAGIFNTAVGVYAYSSGNYNHSIAIGEGADISASSQARIGNSTVTSIGGFANWTNVSDKRFKKDINYESVPGLDFIKKLQPVTYHLDMDAIALWQKTPDSLRFAEYERIKESQLQTGFIAQEVEAAAHKLGYEFSGVDAPKNKEDFYGLRYAEFVVPLVKSVQEQQVEIEELKKQLNAAQQKNQSLEERLNQIEKLLHQ